MFKNKGSSKATKKTKPTVKKLQRQINSLRKEEELKYISTTLNNNVDYNGNIQLVSDCNQGTDFTDRIGKSITSKFMRVRGQVSINASASLGNSVRLVVLFDKQTGGAPAISDVQGNTGSVLAPYGIANVNNLNKRFKILKDFVISVDPINSGETIRHFGFKVNLKNHKVNYLGTTTGSIGMGGIYVYVISDEVNVFGSPPVVRYTTQLFFSDD